MSLAANAIGLLKLAALFDPALAPIAALAGGIDDAVEGETPLLTEFKRFLDGHGGDHKVAALKLRAFNDLSQEEQNAVMDRSGIGNQ